MSYYREQLEAWLKTIDVKANKVLDIGGGANPVKGRTKSWKVKKYLIADNKAEPQKVEPDFCIDITDSQESRREIFDLEGTIDTIFCLEVMEYVFDPMVALWKIINFLKEGGIAYISFPAIYPVHNPIQFDYLRYTKKGIEKLLEQAGFSRWDITPRVATKGKEALGAFYSLEGMHPVKRNDVIYDIGYMVKAWK